MLAAAQASSLISLNNELERIWKEAEGAILVFCVWESDH
jgi:hypothetical protein